MFRSLLVFLCLGWIVFYVNTVTRNASTVLSAPLIVFAVVSPTVFVAVFFLAWRHNHFNYARRCADWDRSFVCERCGTVSEHERDSAPLM